VEHLAVRHAEITGDIAALLSSAGDAESSDFLKRGCEIAIEVLSNFKISQGVRTERLGVVSGETGIFEVAGNMEKKRQFVVLPCGRGRFRGGAQEIDGSAVGCAG
jgi:hypothetical protein